MVMKMLVEATSSSHVALLLCAKHQTRTRQRKGTEANMQSVIYELMTSFDPSNTM
jgi:hypothetical protein